MEYREVKTRVPKELGWRSLFFGFFVIIFAVGLKYWGSTPQAEAQTPRRVQQQRGTANAPQRGARPPRVAQRNAAPLPTPSTAGGVNVVAVVNKEPITRQELGKLCLLRWGKETLEGLVNKHLITEACLKQGIVISEADVDEEIRSLASKFNMSIDQYMKLLREERNVSTTEYRKDIIWPAIALKRLAADQIKVTQDELNKEFESEFGERIQVRMISVTSASKAQQVLQRVQAKPDEFGRVAKEASEDPNSASAKGLIPPVRKHLGDPKIEQAVFALQEGQISNIVETGGQFFIFRCERRLPAKPISAQYRRQIATTLKDRIVERNLRKVSSSIFESLQSEAQIINVMNAPNRSKQAPTVAAFVNGKPITKEELVEECLLRFARDMLDVEITHRLLRQELGKRKLQITQEAINQEIARAAMTFGYANQDGSPNLQAWLKAVTEKEGINAKEYIRDAVWPTVALKLLVDSNVQVTDEDLKKGFEANYGERVEVLAIVLGNQRQAQTVWDMARNRDTNEFFGQLAEQYSIEPISRANFGEIPPIQRHGGQPLIEKEAFQLKPGELSGIIAMGDKYIIMKCLGRTQPIVEQAADVRTELEADIREKKLRIAMSEEYDRIRNAAQIDNFMKRTSQLGEAAQLNLPGKVPVRPVSTGGQSATRRR